MRNVIFDLGGVVFDWNPAEIIETFVARIDTDPMAQRGIATQLKADVFSHPDWLETDRGTLSAADAVARFAERMTLPIDTMQRLWDLCNVLMRPKLETVALMDELFTQGAALYCLSNMPVERYAWLRQHHDLWHCFQGIVISGEIQLIKPDAAIYQHLLQTFDLQAEECIFLDDSAPNVAAANALGIHGILFQDAASCRDDLFALFTQ